MNKPILEEIIRLENERSYLRERLYAHGMRGWIDRERGRILDITGLLARLWPQRRMEMTGSRPKAPPRKNKITKTLTKR